VEEEKTNVDEINKVDEIMKNYAKAHNNYNVMIELAHYHRDITNEYDKMIEYYIMAIDLCSYEALKELIKITINKVKLYSILHNVNNDITHDLIITLLKDKNVKQYSKNLLYQKQKME